MSYGTSVTLDRAFDETVAAVRSALADQGFGVLTEIDLAATLQDRLGVQSEPQLILGACNPPLAHRALQADPSIGLLLPCNVVVRAESDRRTTVEALDPHIMVAVTGNDALAEVADDAATRLASALDSLTG